MMRTPVLLLILALLAIVALVVAFAPLMGVTYAETEPCVISETYTRTEACTEEIALDYEVIEADSINMWWRRFSDCWVTLKNTGNVSGCFRVEFNLLTELGRDTSRVFWQTVEPGKQTRVVARCYEDFVSSFEYSITPPMVEVETLREVEATRDVVEYSEVERAKKVSVLEYLRKWRGQS